MSTKGRVLLVNTPRLRGPHYVVLPPLGLGYLAETLRRSGFEAEILDPIRDGTGLNAFRSFFETQGGRFDAVGFEYYSTMRSAVMEFARVVKTTRPEVWTLAGGPHPSAEPEECLQENPYLDFAVTTDSETIVPDLLERLGSGRTATLREVPGLAFRDNGHVMAPSAMNRDAFVASPESSGDRPSVVVNPFHAFPDVNDIPSPAWDLMPPETYPLVPNGVFTRNRRIATMVATRGCPYPCKFCEVPIKSGRKLRRRHPENVVAEIERLKKDHGVQEIHFMDDALTLDRRYAQSLFEAVIRSGVKIDWAVPNGVRLDCLDAETLQLMERSGCYSVAVGIESGSQRILDRMKKQLDLEEIRRQVALVRSTTSIRMTGFFIIGYPGETPEDMDATIRFACGLPLHRANFFNYIPFPGGPMYKELKAAGLVRPDHYDEHTIYSISYVSEGLSYNIIKHYLRKSNLRFYLRPSILWGLTKEIRAASQIGIIASRARAILA